MHWQRGRYLARWFDWRMDRWSVVPDGYYPGGIAKQCRQFVAQIRAQGGDVVAAVQNAVVIKLLGHVIRASFNARTTVDWPPESPDNQYHLNK